MVHILRNKFNMSQVYLFWMIQEDMKSKHVSSVRLINPSQMESLHGILLIISKSIYNFLMFDSSNACEWKRMNYSSLNFQCRSGQDALHCLSSTI